MSKTESVTNDESDFGKKLETDPTFISLMGTLKKDHNLEIGAVLGRGSFSVVQQATISGKKVAVKVIDTRSPSEYVKRFLPREMLLVKQVKHENIIRVDEVLKFEHFVVFLTEFCEGGDLLQKILKTKFIPEDESKFLFRQIIEGLIYLQKSEVIHRDLKCENIFLDRNDNVKIGDFGFARYLKKGEYANTFCGSRAYTAPELLRAQKYTGFTADIWSAGVVLYVMVTGLMPFDDRNPHKMVERQLQHKIKFPRKAHLSMELKELVFAILHPYPASRPTYENMCSSKWLKQTTYSIKGSGSKA